jgi:hypothetical protein
MTDAPVEVTTQVLEAFADAWNRHDANALMSLSPRTNRMPQSPKHTSSWSSNLLRLR